MNNYSTTVGEYISDQIKVLDRLHVTLGVRNDQYVQAGYRPARILLKTPYQSEIVRAVDKQAGAVFDVTTALSVYSSWSTSTTPNTVTDVNAQGQSGFAAGSGHPVRNRPEIRDEGSQALYLALLLLHRSHERPRGENGITIPATGQAVFRVDGGQHSEGFELETEWHPVPYWQVQIGATIDKAFVAESILIPTPRRRPGERAARHRHDLDTLQCPERLP